MRLIRLLLACTCLVPLLAATPAHAASTDRHYVVEITGIHVVDWRYASESWPDRCKPWDLGSGEQTIGFTTTSPMRFKAYLKRPPVPKGQLPFSFYPMSQGRWRTTITRKGEWTGHDVPDNCTPCGPLSEYGPCPPEDDPLAPPRYDCGTKRLARTSADAGYFSKGYKPDDDPLPAVDRVEVVIQLTVDAPFANCPPDLGGKALAKLAQPTPLRVRITGAAAARLPRLGRGRRLTLKGSAERGQVGGQAFPDDCAKTKGDGGYRECATTDVTLEVRRTR